MRRRKPASNLKRVESMRHVSRVAVIVMSLAAPVAAQPQPILHCFRAETQIGVVARRDYFDDRGLVIKEVLYRSSDRTGQHTCAEDMLRVYSITNITRDALGRSVVETEMSPDEKVERVLRHEYAGDDAEASRDIWSAPDGTRRYEIRHGERGRATHLYFNSAGRVIGVTGPLPTDVEYALRWGTEVDGWSCGIAVASGSVNVHMKNGTRKETAITFGESIDMELRSAAAGTIPLLPASTANRAASSRFAGISRLVAPGDAAFYTYSLEARYGPLAPGRYSLTVRSPHPVSGVMVLSNRVEFDIPAVSTDRER